MIRISKLLRAIESGGEGGLVCVCVFMCMCCVGV